MRRFGLPLCPAARETSAVKRSAELAVRTQRPALGWLLMAVTVSSVLGGCAGNSVGGIPGHYVAEEMPEIHLILSEDHTFRLWGPSLTIGGKEAIGEWAYKNGEIALYEYFRHVSGELTRSANPMTQLTKRGEGLKGRAFAFTREFTWRKE